MLTSLTTSLQSATSSLPEESTILPPKDGISLLDVKNELFLSYVQNLVFLIIVKLRHDGDQAKEGLSLIHEEVVKKLAELRLYLEKGVRPLEGRLKYQIDKVVRAAEDADRAAKSQPNKGSETSKKTEIEVEGSDEEESDASEDIDELSYRPNISAMMRPATKPNRNRDDEREQPDGIYRPPHITPTVMPVTRGKEEREERRPAKSATLDEFIATELSSAPIVEPSIGSTIISGGRRDKTQRERDDEAERRAYEESHFVRLPKESKKDRAKKGGRVRDGGFGGEEWRNLDIGLDRIERLTQKSGSSSGLARSRKRAIDDGPRDSGEQAGTKFARRLRNVKRRLK